MRSLKLTKKEWKEIDLKDEFENKGLGYVIITDGVHEVYKTNDKFTIARKDKWYPECKPPKYITKKLAGIQL